MKLEEEGMIKYFSSDLPGLTTTDWPAILSSLGILDKDGQKKKTGASQRFPSLVTPLDWVNKKQISQITSPTRNGVTSFWSLKENGTNLKGRFKFKELFFTALVCKYKQTFTESWNILHCMNQAKVAPSLGHRNEYLELGREGWPLVCRQVKENTSTNIPWVLIWHDRATF